MSSESSQRSWSDWARRLLSKGRQLDLRLMGLNSHAGVICGLGRIGIQLARDVHEAGTAGSFPRKCLQSECRSVNVLF